MLSSPEDWIGKQESCEDRLDPSHACRIAAMLDRPFPQEGDALAALWHWAFFQIPVPPAATGQDGHIAPGGFLPKSEGNTRMWAGGGLTSTSRWQSVNQRNVSRVSRQ